MPIKRITLLYMRTIMTTVDNFKAKDIQKRRLEDAIPKIKMLCNLHCLKARLSLLCNKYQWHSSLNLVSQQLSYITYLFSEWRILCFQKSVQLDVQQCVRDSAFQINHETRGTLGI